MAKSLACFCLLGAALVLARSAQDPVQAPASTTPRPSANPYKLAWSRHFELLSSLDPAFAADDGGLWLITAEGRRKPHEMLSRIDSEGNLKGSYDPAIPLKPTEWVSYLSPATSGNSVGLLASLASGGKEQTFEGAFFLPVGTSGVGVPRRIAGRGPQFPSLIGAGLGEFIAAGDQDPLTLLKLDSTGTVLWRRSFSRKLVLPTVAVDANRTILMASQAGSYLQLQLLSESGRLMASKQVPARQGTVVADSEGGWTLLFSKGFGGKENRVYLMRLDPMLRSLGEMETPVRGDGGRTYQLMATPHGSLVIGRAPEGPQQIIAEFDHSGKLMWQGQYSTSFTPVPASFGAGFYVVMNLGGGTTVEKYLYTR